MDSPEILTKPRRECSRIIKPLHNNQWVPMKLILKKFVRSLEVAMVVLNLLRFAVLLAFVSVPWVDLPSLFNRPARRTSYVIIRLSLSGQQQWISIRNKNIPVMKPIKQPRLKTSQRRSQIP